MNDSCNDALVGAASPLDVSPPLTLRAVAGTAIISAFMGSMATVVVMRWHQRRDNRIDPDSENKNLANFSSSSAFDLLEDDPCSASTKKDGEHSRESNLSTIISLQPNNDAEKTHSRDYKCKQLRRSSAPIPLSFDAVNALAPRRHSDGSSDSEDWFNEPVVDGYYDEVTSAMSRGQYSEKPQDQLGSSDAEPKNICQRSPLTNDEGRDCQNEITSPAITFESANVDCACSACPYAPGEYEDQIMNNTHTRTSRGSTEDTFCPAPIFPKRLPGKRRATAHSRWGSWRDSVTRDSSTKENAGRDSMSVKDSLSTCDVADPVICNVDLLSTHESHKVSKRTQGEHTRDTYDSSTGDEEFDELVAANIHDLSRSLEILQRSRAISSLANRLMTAPDEEKCFEEVARLIAAMFKVERVSFGMLTGSEHFLLKRINVVSKGYASTVDLEFLDSDYKRPLAGTSVGVCEQTLREHYTPRTKESSFATHRVLYQLGINTVLATPILVNGNKCAGCILLPNAKEDAFKALDRILISDIASLLGANIYAKRLRKTTEEANKISREMLHSFIPPKVLEKIECFWDTKSEEYKSLKASSPDSSVIGSTGSPDQSTLVRSNSWYVANSDWSEAVTDEHITINPDGIQGKIQLIKDMNRNVSGESDHLGVIVSTSGLDLSPTSRALYAENVSNVCIIFSDIVGFSRIAMNVKPIRLMDMLQDLFNRFDQLCDLHGVLKLETIGDAYLCVTNLLEENSGDDGENGAKDAAKRALAMAKDMISEARNVRVPCPDGVLHYRDFFKTLQIRVGIHVGDITCGVLGQRLPKFSTCGTAVNMAARMEQTSQPNMIRVTKDFHDLVGDAETEWLEKELTPVKNMGMVETYLLDRTQHKM